LDTSPVHVDVGPVLVSPAFGGEMSQKNAKLIRKYCAVTKQHFKRIWVTYNETPWTRRAILREGYKRVVGK